MKEMPPILKFTNLESSTLEKGFFVYLRQIFRYWGMIFILLNFFDFKQIWRLIYSGKPDVSFKFNYDKN